MHQHQSNRCLVGPIPFLLDFLLFWHHIKHLLGHSTLANLPWFCSWHHVQQPLLAFITDLRYLIFHWHLYFCLSGFIYGIKRWRVSSMKLVYYTFHHHYFRIYFTWQHLIASHHSGHRKIVCKGLQNYIRMEDKLTTGAFKPSISLKTYLETPLLFFWFTASYAGSNVVACHQRCYITCRIYNYNYNYT